MSDIKHRLSQSLKSVDGFRWSPYLDEYLVELSHDSSLPQDKVLVRQVKMQLIANQFRYPSWKLHDEIPSNWVDTLQLQLDEIISVTSGTSSEVGSELGFYHYTTLIIREWIKIKSPTPRNEPDLRRYQVYQRCLNSIKAWLEIFFAMPLHGYVNVPCSTYSQLCYVVLFLRQITTTRNTDYHPATAEEVIDPLQTMGRIIQTFEQLKTVAAAQDPDSGEDQALILGIKKFQLLKSTWYGDVVHPDKIQRVNQEAEMTGSATESSSFVGFHMLPNMPDGIIW